MSEPASQKIRVQHGFPSVEEDFPRYGTRDDVAPEKGRDTVVCLGCSHTYGYTSIEQTWPSFLQKRLGHGRQVLNMGRRNYGLELIVRWYRHFAVGLAPSVCIIQVPLFCRQPLPGVQDDDIENYTMGRGAYKLYRTGKISRSKFIVKSNEMFDRDLQRLKEFFLFLSSEQTVPVVLPYRTPHINYAFREFKSLVDLYYREVILLADKMHVSSCKDKKLSNAYFAHKKYLIDSTHPNPQGNRFIAKRVHEAMP